MSTNNDPPYTLDDLPVGTEIVSLADETVIGTVTSHSETRGMPEVMVSWSNGKNSIIWLHQMRNKKCNT